VPGPALSGHAPESKFNELTGRRGLSQAEAAAIAGVPQSNVPGSAAASCGTFRRNA